jgi:hypothetical protein
MLLQRAAALQYFDKTAAGTAGDSDVDNLKGSAR